MTVVSLVEQRINEKVKNYLVEKQLNLERRVDCLERLKGRVDCLESVAHAHIPPHDHIV
jgi:hypothetical protein